jgi:hypothetical protein
MNTRQILLAGLVPALLLLGCDRNTSETVNTSEPPPPPAQSAAPAPAAQPTTATPQGTGMDAAGMAAMSRQLPAAPQSGAMLTYKLPAGWTEAPGGGPMRHATITGPDGAQIAVTVFGGDVGGNLANVNRWRSQMGLEPTTEAQMQADVIKVQTAGPTALMVDLKKADASQRMLAAIIPDAGKTWFLKFQGPTDVVSKHADDYTRILKSCSFSQPQP